MHLLFLAALLIGAVSGALHPPLGKFLFCHNTTYCTILISSAPLLPLEESEKIIPEEYIVVFKKDASVLDG